MIITFTHYKGGTGKTTSCISFAGYLAREGNRVLVVDLDPQGNSTSGLGVDKETVKYNMYDVLSKAKNIKSIILETNIPNIHLAPSHQNLEKSKIYTYRRKSEALILKNVLKEIKNYYDYILVDTPPVHCHFIINGMAAADKIVAVLDPGIFALEGLSTLKEAFGNYFKKLGLNLEINSALITKCSNSFWPFGKNYSKDIKKDTESILGKQVFLIPYSTKIYEAQVKGIPISHYKPNSNVGKAYQNAIINILNN